MWAVGCGSHAMALLPHCHAAPRPAPGFPHSTLCCSALRCAVRAGKRKDKSKEKDKKDKKRKKSSKDKKDKKVRRQRQGHVACARMHARKHAHLRAYRAATTLRCDGCVAVLHVMPG